MIKVVNNCWMGTNNIGSMLFSAENNIEIMKSCEHQQYEYSVVYNTIVIDGKSSSKLQNAMTPCLRKSSSFLT